MEQDKEIKLQKGQGGRIVDNWDMAEAWVPVWSAMKKAAVAEMEKNPIFESSEALERGYEGHMDLGKFSAYFRIECLVEERRLILQQEMERARKDTDCETEQ